MPSPEVYVGGITLIDEGRVRIREVDREGRVLAIVQGTSEMHAVRRSAAGRWTCTCQAGQYGRACRHREAVRMVTRAKP
jgi:hypothetical protein